MSKAPRSLRYSSTDAMPAGMRTLLQRQQAQPRGYKPPAAPEKRANKYGAIPTVVDGIRFDSKREANYYQRLKLEQGAGQVQYFLRQVPLHLPGGTKLVVDFVVVMADGRIRYVDAKGRETATFRVKRREVEHHYPIQIELV
ncbi:hypothetical protein CO641_02305 [Lysobacteraceae bacterium NML91-0213]|nr:hypothetical protein CO641_02305 [Xanthomonadaceae bacterium NML91-0213]